MLKFLKEHGLWMAWAIFCFVLYGFAQTQDAKSNWRFAKEATGSYYAGK